MNYEQLYMNEKKQREQLMKDIDKKCKEIDKLKTLLRTKENELISAKKQILSHVNSNTAKDGYREEEDICNDLNKNTILRANFEPILGTDYDECYKMVGNHKCDIQSNNKNLKAQVKKYKIGQFQQLDRHWVDDLIKNIPGLESERTILKDLCEYPLLPNGTSIDKTKPIKKLCSTNYSQEQLDKFLLLLNENKRQILDYAFIGTNHEMQPDYLFGVEYLDNKRTKIVLCKITDIIEYLETLHFTITKGKTVVVLGDDNILSMQRKGGDGGKKSSNQLQFKLTISKLLDKVFHLQQML